MVKDTQLAVETLNLSEDLLVMAGDNVLDFSLSSFVEFTREKNTSCVMCYEENELKKQQKTAIITVDADDLITSYEEKPKELKGSLAVPPFYCYWSADVKLIQEALDNDCGYDMMRRAVLPHGSASRNRCTPFGCRENGTTSAI